MAYRRQTYKVLRAAQVLILKTAKCAWTLPIEIDFSYISCYNSISWVSTIQQKYMPWRRQNEREYSSSMVRLGYLAWVCCPRVGCGGRGHLRDLYWQHSIGSGSPVLEWAVQCSFPISAHGCDYRDSAQQLYSGCARGSSDLCPWLFRACDRGCHDHERGAGRDRRQDDCNMECSVPVWGIPLDDFWPQSTQYKPCIAVRASKGPGRTRSGPFVF